MAFQKTYTAPYGNLCPASYWRVNQVNLNASLGQGSIEVYGFVDKASRDSGLPPLFAKTYPLSGAAFTNLAATALSSLALPATATVYDAIAKAAYNYIMATPDPANPAAGSFFTGAVAV